MVRTLRGCAAVILPLALSACGSETTALGPTPPGEGIVIYMHADFGGSSQGINVDVPDLTKAQGPCSSGAEGEVPSWTKCVSSIRVFPGWTATIYRDEDFKGRSLAITADTPNLRSVAGPCDGSFNDCIRSIRVTRQ